MSIFRSFRILIFTQYFWPESFRINALARTLKAQGHEVSVLTGKPNYPEGLFFSGYKGLGIQKETWQGIPIFRIPILARGRQNALRLALNYLSFVVSGLLFAPFVLRKQKIDVIFVYAPSPVFQVIPASFLGWLKRVPVVLWVQDLWPQSAKATGHVESALLLKLLEKLVLFSYAHTDLLLVQSQAFVAPVAKLSPVHVPVLYYPNSVEDTFYAPQAIDALSIETLQNGFSVLFAGNIGTAQGVSTIVNAAKLLKIYSQINIVMMGSGSMSDWVAQQKQKHDLNNLHLVGRFPAEMMPSMMKQASVLLVTLKQDPIFALTIPSKVQDYLATGKPIVAALDGEGARVIEESGAGLTCAAEDAKGLADAILALYHMPEKDRVAMGNNGHAYFLKHFEMGRQAKKLIEILKQRITEKEREN
ncbi:glycosyltransferase family 4 protein [Methylomarinum vadi]|uniref:glycosyltransferase family 4 protein n=1 Tax=Methylomarinum vadi TaxID=438855 RepID=UPI0004DF7C60|nr:glycosyltransferase family 4 protein [Methylomarinum vadi]